jgi:hypothetical protein
VYIASASDPEEAIFKELHLTPNSVNIHARWLPLAPGLRIGGYVEKSQIVTNTLESIEDDDVIAVREGDESISIAREVLESTSGIAADDDDVENTSIFVLKAVHAHTVNQLLFFCHEELSQAAVSLCIMPWTPELSETTMNVKGCSVIFPPSLQVASGYQIVEFKLQEPTEPSTKAKWVIKEIVKLNY